MDEDADSGRACAMHVAVISATTVTALSMLEQASNLLGSALEFWRECARRHGLKYLHSEHDLMPKPAACCEWPLLKSDEWLVGPKRANFIILLRAVGGGRDCVLAGRGRGAPQLSGHGAREGRIRRPTHPSRSGNNCSAVAEL